LKILINSIESEIPDSSLQKIGQGGEGVIYLITLNGQKFAVKKYYKPNENLHKKVKAMLDKAPDDSVQKINSQTFIQLAWPIGLCYDGSVFCGFVMPYVDLNHTNTLDFYLDPRLFKEKFGSGNLSLTFKIEIARNLAGVVKLLHSKGHFFIDFKPQNVRVYDRYHLISLIDCDGFSIEGATGERFPANGYSSEYIYPEALQKNKRPQELGIKQDLFALSVVIFQLLNYGIHPFSGIINPGDSATTTDDKVSQGYYPYGLNIHLRIKPLNYSAHNFIPNNLRTLFDKAFVANSNYPPKVEEWINEFEDVISNQKLQKCKKHPTKPDHIHFGGHDCMACMRDAITSNVKIKTKPFKSLSTGSSSSSGLPQYPTNKQTPFWDRDRVIGVGGIAVLLFLIVYGMSGRDNNQSQKSTSNKTTTNVSSQTTAQSPSVWQNMMTNFSAHRWADESTNCQIYWTISKNQDGTYSLNLINTNDSSKNFSDQVLSYTFFQNYQLDSGIIINNVMKMETKSLYIDIAYISGTEPAIRVYRLEDKENNLLVTQGRRIKDGALTAVRKKCS
jgi:serine/threonine protein kinase